MIRAGPSAGPLRPGSSRLADGAASASPLLLSEVGRHLNRPPSLRRPCEKFSHSIHFHGGLGRTNSRLHGYLFSFSETPLRHSPHSSPSCSLGCPVRCSPRCSDRCGLNSIPRCGPGCCPGYGSSCSIRCSVSCSTRCSTGRSDRCGLSRRPPCSPRCSVRCFPDCG